MTHPCSEYDPWFYLNETVRGKDGKMWRAIEQNKNGKNSAFWVKVKKKNEKKI